MRNAIILIAILAVAFTVVAVGRRAIGNKMPGDDSIEYRGQQFKLNKSYEDYDDYKNDPDNLAPGEAGKAQRVMQSAQIAKRYSSREEMIRAVFDLKFPGYGLSSHSEKPQADGTVLALFSIEIPQSGNDRYLLFRGNGGVYTLIDDFVYAESAAIVDVSVNGDKLEYRTPQGTKVMERTPLAK